MPKELLQKKYRKCYYKTTEKPLSGAHAKAEKLLKNLLMNMQKKTCKTAMSKNVIVYANDSNCV